MVCILGIDVCYLAYGVLHEKIFRVDYGGERFGYTLFLVWAQCVANALWAWSMMHLLPGDRGAAAKNRARRVPWHEYALLALCYCLTLSLSFAALQYVSYPLQVLIKSCKMVPVMAMGALVRRRRYSWQEVLRVLLITGGIIGFSQQQWMAATTASRGYDAATPWIGISLLVISLLLDGVIGALQERLVARYAVSSGTLMACQNLWSAIWVTAPLLGSGEASAALQFVRRHRQARIDLLLFALLSALGQTFVFSMLRHFSALTLATVTTTRKFFTVLLSIAWYGHAVSRAQWLGIALVFSGLGWEVIAKTGRERRRGKAVARSPPRGRRRQAGR